MFFCFSFFFSRTIKKRTNKPMNQLTNNNKPMNQPAISCQLFFSSFHTAAPSLVLQALHLIFALNDHFCTYFFFALSLSAAFCPQYNSHVPWFFHQTDKGVLSWCYCKVSANDSEQWVFSDSASDCTIIPFLQFFS